VSKISSVAQDEGFKMDFFCLEEMAGRDVLADDDTIGDDGLGSLKYEERPGLLATATASTTEDKNPDQLLKNFVSILSSFYSCTTKQFSYR
jgi:hypothetical protein